MSGHFRLRGTRHALRFANALPRRREDGARRGVPRAVTTPVLDLEGRVVDRREEFAQLQAAVDQAGRVGGGCILLSGVPGVGKSTLMQAFGDEVSPAQLLVRVRQVQGRRAGAVFGARGSARARSSAPWRSTGPAERDRWRADVLGGTSALTGILGELVPGLAGSVRRGGQLDDLDAADARRRLQRAVID